MTFTCKGCYSSCCGDYPEGAEFCKECELLNEQTKLIAENELLKVKLEKAQLAGMVKHDVEVRSFMLADIEAQKADLAAARERISTLEGALRNLLTVSEHADETGYVDGVGFLDIDAIQQQAHAALSTQSEKGEA